jgi:hypothetical protein
VRFWQQVFVSGVALTAVAGAITALFPNTVFWAPGIVVAFFINGGGHESHLSPGWFWSIAAVVNFFPYSMLSWILIVAFQRIRDVSNEAKS